MAYTPYSDQVFSTAYRLAQAPQARNDGSGLVSHDIWSQYSVDEVDWSDDAHWTVEVPAVDLETVLVMADGTGPERAAKNAAYKQLLVNNRNTAAAPVTGTDDTTIAARANANGRATSAAAGADEYITVTLSQSYPVRFNL